MSEFEGVEPMYFDEQGIEPIPGEETLERIPISWWPTSVGPNQSRRYEELAKGQNYQANGVFGVAPYVVVNEAMEPLGQVAVIASTGPVLLNDSPAYRGPKAVEYVELGVVAGNYIFVSDNVDGKELTRQVMIAVNAIAQYPTWEGNVVFLTFSGTGTWVIEGPSCGLALYVALSGLVSRFFYAGELDDSTGLVTIKPVAAIGAKARLCHDKASLVTFVDNATIRDVQAAGVAYVPPTLADRGLFAYVTGKGQKPVILISSVAALPALCLFSMKSVHAFIPQGNSKVMAGTAKKGTGPVGARKPASTELDPLILEWMNLPENYMQTVNVWAKNGWPKGTAERVERLQKIAEESYKPVPGVTDLPFREYLESPEFQELVNVTKASEKKIDGLKKSLWIADQKNPGRFYNQSFVILKEWAAHAEKMYSERSVANVKGSKKDRLKAKAKAKKGGARPNLQEIRPEMQVYKLPVRAGMKVADWRDKTRDMLKDYLKNYIGDESVHIDDTRSLARLLQIFNSIPKVLGIGTAYQSTLEMIRDVVHVPRRMSDEELDEVTALVSAMESAVGQGTKQVAPVVEEEIDDLNVIVPARPRVKQQVAKKFTGPPRVAQPKYVGVKATIL